MAEFVDLEMRPRRWAIVAFATTLIGAFLGVLGPFGSYLNPDPMLRLGFWIASIWTGLLLYGVGIAAARKLTPPGSQLRWAGLSLSILIASVPQAALTRTSAFLIWPELHRFGPGWATWYAQVATIGAVTVAGAVMLLEARSKRVDQPETTQPANPFDVLRGDVIALQMEDHYVRVHKASGSALILMPLTRAIEAIAPTEGLRMHRSWWVARSAVERIEGSPRAMRLHLVNGLVAPVSRSAIAMLRMSGWLSRHGQMDRFHCSEGEEPERR